MRLLCLVVTLSGCGMLRSATLEPISATPVPPGFDRFHSSAVHQSIDVDASGVSERMTLFLHDRGGRISFGTVSSTERRGALAYAMQFLRLPTEAIDAAMVDRTLCVLRSDAKIVCAELGTRDKREIAVDPTSTRLLSLGNDVICAMRAAGDFACFNGSKGQAGVEAMLAANGAAADVIAEAPCFITRDKKLVCVDRPFMVLALTKKRRNLTIPVSSWAWASSPA